MKRAFDILLSLFALLMLFPVFLFISAWVKLDSRGGIFYSQIRVGRGNRDFRMYKFRTMHPGADQKGLLTVGGRDPRVSRAGYYLRKAKIDELPQLFNILIGNMSFVGPRPEVRKYVDMYTHEQMAVLQVRPGLTDYASLEYFDENNLLSSSPDPEKIYINEIMPAKLQLNLKYIREQSLSNDLRIIMRTIGVIFNSN
ncbi:MAG TPA: sugar transferase [Bacteroidales bacterium]|nr:sugar transferase [Bacteroidales bacterium]